MSGNTCEGCRYYEKVGVRSDKYQHHCWASAERYIRAWTEYPDAPRRCRHYEGEEQ